jgi:hypothetical protein
MSSCHNLNFAQDDIISMVTVHHDSLCLKNESTKTYDDGAAIHVKQHGRASA